MTQGTISEEMERREQDNSPAKALCDRLTAATLWFGRLLPPPEQGGMAPEAFVAQLLNMIRRNRQPAFLAAIKNDPDSFIYAATDCAALNLKPAEEYWWVPFNDKSGGTGYHFTGMPGWKGEVQQIYRAGSVKSVKFAVVYRGDYWSWRPTRMETPEFEPITEDRTRENLWKVYAYAEIMSGGISQVVVFNRSEVYRAKDKSKTKEFWNSEWEPEMWLKTALHRLFDYVPHSAGYNLQLMQAWAVALERYPSMQIGAGDGDTPMALDPATSSAGPTPVPGQVVNRGPVAPVMPGNGQQNSDPGDDGHQAPFPGGAIQGKAEHVEPKTEPKTKAAAKAEPKTPAEGTVGAGAHDWPDVPLDGKVSKPTAGKLGAKWTSVGWTGDDFKEQRRVMAGLLAAGKGGKPLDLRTPAQMLEGQARTAILTFEAVCIAATRDGEQPADRLQRMYDEFTAALEQAAAHTETEKTQ